MNVDSGLLRLCFGEWTAPLRTVWQAERDKSWTPLAAAHPHVWRRDWLRWHFLTNCVWQTMRFCGTGADHRPSSGISGGTNLLLQPNVCAHMCLFGRIKMFFYHIPSFPFSLAQYSRSSHPQTISSITVTDLPCSVLSPLYIFPLSSLYVITSLFLPDLFYFLLILTFNRQPPPSSLRRTHFPSDFPCPTLTPPFSNPESWLIAKIGLFLTVYVYIFNIDLWGGSILEWLHNTVFPYLWSRTHPHQAAPAASHPREFCRRSCSRGVCFTSVIAKLSSFTLEY